VKKPQDLVGHASPTTAMTHVAIQEALNGKVVDWLEPSERRAISALMFE
jgi:hypothetical protein